MQEKIQVQEVVAKKKYLVKVLFQDGTKGEYDLSHLAGKGVFKAWEKNDHFFQVYINPESGAITWPGELDIDTIAVYCKIRDIDVNEYLKAQSLHAKAL
jgi:hypothetical protein